MDNLSEISLRALLENAHMGVVIHRWDTTIVYANPAALRLLRLRYEQLLGKDAMDPGWHFVDENGRRLRPEDYPVNKVRATGRALRSEVIGVVDGHSPEIGWFNVNAYPESDADADAAQHGFIVVVFSELSLDRAGFSFRDIVEHADDMVIVTEADDINAPSGPRIVYVNRAFEVESGYTAQEVIGETPRILQGGLTDPAARQRIRDHLERKSPVREKLLNYTKSGVPYWVEMNIVPLRNRFGDVTHFAAIERNISQATFRAEQLERRNQDLRLLKENLRVLVDTRTQELRDANQKLERLAYYDALTMIPNRRSFLDLAEKQWSRAMRDQETLAIGVLDLDHFKQVNDDFGHDVGDRLLVSVASALNRFFRKEDIYGRLGGEEFAFCISVSEVADVPKLADRLRIAIADIRLELESNTTLQATASIGIAVSLSGSPCRMAEAMVQADRALYRAKANGRNTIEITSVSQPPSA